VGVGFGGVFLIGICLLASLFASTAMAAGSPVQEVTGSFLEGQPSFTVRHVGKAAVVDFTAPVDFSGGIAGAATSTGREIIAPTGDFTVQAVVTCSCSVAGRTGTLVLRFTGTGSFLTQQKQGEFAVSGSGGLAGIHGHGAFMQSALTGDYEAHILFDS